MYNEIQPLLREKMVKEMKNTKRESPTKLNGGLSCLIGWVQWNHPGEAVALLWFCDRYIAGR